MLCAVLRLLRLKLPNIFEAIEAKIFAFTTFTPTHSVLSTVSFILNPIKKRVSGVGKKVAEIFPFLFARSVIAYVSQRRELRTGGLEKSFPACRLHHSKNYSQEECL
jgi:hypothetical protein